MPRAVLDLMNTETLNLVQGQWRRALGYVPGEANEGLVSQLEGSPRRDFPTTTTLLGMSATT